MFEWLAGEVAYAGLHLFRPGQEFVHFFNIWVWPQVLQFGENNFEVVFWLQIVHSCSAFQGVVEGGGNSSPWGVAEEPCRSSRS